MQDQTQKLKAIRRLLGSFAERRGPVGETVEQRADRLALVTHGYLTAIDGFDANLIEAGVDLVLRGGLPGHDMSFAPTAPQFATACRMAAERASRQRYLNGLTAPRLPPPEIVKTPEQRERAREMVQGFVASQSPEHAEPQVAEQRRRDMIAKHDSFFADEFVPTEGGVGRISKTLAKKLGYSVGSPESDDAAA
jgi:hypothetical protein